MTDSDCGEGWKIASRFTVKIRIELFGRLQHPEEIRRRGTDRRGLWLFHDLTVQQHGNGGRTATEQDIERPVALSKWVAESRSRGHEPVRYGQELRVPRRIGDVPDEWLVSLVTAILARRSTRHGFDPTVGREPAPAGLSICEYFMSLVVCFFRHISYIACYGTVVGPSRR